MVSQLGLAGIQAGITSSCLKWSGEILTEGDLGAVECWILSVTLFVAVCSGVLQFTFLNAALASYQQIDFSAVYQVTIMVFTVVCALVLLDEAGAYSTSGLISILACTGLCIIGIYVVTLKSNLPTAASTFETDTDTKRSTKTGEEALLKEERDDEHTRYLINLFKEKG